MHLFALATLATPATGSPPSMSPAQCSKCDEYKGILSNALLDMINIHNYVNSMTASSEMQWNIDMRRASTFNQLYEASVLKETAAISHSTAGTSIAIEETASKELD